MSFTWDEERPVIPVFSGTRGEDVYAFGSKIKHQEYDYRLWAKQTIDMLLANVDGKAKREVIKGVEHAIEVKTSLQDNFREQALEGIKRLYRMYGAPNLSLHLACQQGIVWVVREAIYEGQRIGMDAQGRLCIPDIKKKKDFYKTTAKYKECGSVVQRLYSMSIKNQEYNFVDDTKESSEKSLSSPCRLSKNSNKMSTNKVVVKPQ